MKLVVLSGLVLLTLVSAMAQPGVNPGYTTSASGLEYKFHKHNPDLGKAKDGDILFLNIKIKTESEDSMLFNSDEVLKREGFPYFEQLVNPTFQGDYSEVLAMMHLGDSVTAKIDADTFFYYVFKIDSVPTFVKVGSKVAINIKLEKYLSLDSFKVYFNRVAADKEANQRVLEDKRIADFVAANKITAKPTTSGLYFIETKKGKGKKIKKGMFASVLYTGMFLDSIPFDSNKGQELFTLPVAQGMVIPGWDEALLLMSKGSKASLIIPYRLAYGSRTMAGVIPPYATLLFDIEVVKVEKEPKQKK